MKRVMTTLALLASGVPAAQARLVDWPTVGGNALHSGPAHGSAVNARTTSRLTARWKRSVGGMVTAAPLILGRERLVVVGSNTGVLTALRLDTGKVAWRRQLGTRADACPQLVDAAGHGRYGISGAPVLDTIRRTIYAADALGRVHALDARSGRERAGWPITLLAHPDQELFWGGLTLNGRRLYLTTGAYCDRQPYTGHIYRVDTATRRTVSFAPNTTPTGDGGGGLWGPAGVAIDAAGDVWAASANASIGHGLENRGNAEKILHLSADLKLKAAGKPTPLPTMEDGGFGATPTLFHPTGCPALVTAPSKDAHLYVFTRGPLTTPRFVIHVLPVGNLIGMAVWDARTQRLVMATDTGLHAYRFTRGCTAVVPAWGAPTRGVAVPLPSGDVVIGSGGRRTRDGFARVLEVRRLATGKLVRTLKTDASYTQPAIAGRWLVSVAVTGTVRAYALR